MVNALLPKGVEIKNLISKLRTLAWSASDKLIFYQKKFLINNTLDFNNFKVDEEPVSKADLEVNKLILEFFENNFNAIDWNIVSEENNKSDFFPLSNKKWTWIIDPLDGTKDFLNGTDEFAIHIALLYEKKPILGVVVLPALEELWFGVKNLGVWYENRAGVKVSDFKNKNKLDELILISSKNHKNKDLNNILAKFSCKKVYAGSIGYKICSILKGLADVYISVSGKTAPKDWDIAAPAFILEEAGGIFCEINSKSLNYLNINYEQRGCLIAARDNKTYLFAREVIKIK